MARRKSGVRVPAMFGRNLRDLTFELNFRALQLTANLLLGGLDVASEDDM
jgi:hypothetical protein